ncbi:MAG: hypothetical protein P8Y61_11175 [Gammaproteobacteria bacterium]
MPFKALVYVSVTRSLCCWLRHNNYIDVANLVTVVAETFAYDAPDTISADGRSNAFLGNCEPDTCCLQIIATPKYR